MKTSKFAFQIIWPLAPKKSADIGKLNKIRLYQQSWAMSLLNSIIRKRWIIFLSLLERKSIFSFGQQILWFIWTLVICFWGFLELVFSCTLKSQKIYLKSKCIKSLTKIDFKQFILKPNCFNRIVPCIWYMELACWVLHRHFGPLL